MKTKTKKLWLRNTSRYPKEEVFICCRAAIDSVERSLSTGEQLPPVIVKFTNTSEAFRGRATWTERDPVKHVAPGIWRSIVWYRVLVRVGNPDWFPRRVNYWRFKDMPEYEFRTYREAIIGVTAHEIGHVLGATGRKAGEEKCELMLQDAVDYYRKNQAEIDAQIEAALVASKIREAKCVPQNPEIKRGAKLEKALAKLNQWQRRERSAHRKVQSYMRRVKYYRKLLEQSESVPLAALPKPSDMSIEHTAVTEV